jgi:hypothetical protein
LGNIGDRICFARASLFSGALKAGDLVKYAPTSWAAFEKELINNRGLILEKAGRYWGVQWLESGIIRYHLETDIEIISERK